jgi:hypothetical protein
MAVGNLVLKKGVASIYTTVGAAGPVYDSVSTGYTPADLLPISGASTITLTLPPARLTVTTLGGGDGQQLQFQNLAAQAVAFAAASTDTIVGVAGSTTLAQNATRTFIADAANNRWYSF